MLNNNEGIALQYDNVRLTQQYDKGIIKTGFKSNLLSKINALREILDMPLRSEAIPEKHYDAQVVNKLNSIDFSPLDNFYTPGLHNCVKYGALNFTGLGFSPAEYVPENNLDVTIDLAGAAAEI